MSRLRRPKPWSTPYTSAATRTTIAINDPRDGTARRRYPGGGYPGGRYPGGGYPGGGYPGGGRYPRQQENRPNGKKILQRIAEETGGRYFEAKKKDSVDDIYAQIAEELRTQFMLGYTPPKDQQAATTPYT